MLAPQRTMETILQINYPSSISRNIRKRYCELLVARAVRFYIVNNLDRSVVNEDLYNGEDFDCSCSQGDADKGKHQSTCEFIKYPYPHLSFSENEEKKYQLRMGLKGLQRFN